MDAKNDSLNDGTLQIVRLKLTKRALRNLVSLAKIRGVSLSELIERIGQSLSEEKLKEIFPLSANES